jgi:16S rRNA processing protein RimM
VLRKHPSSAIRGIIPWKHVSQSFIALFSAASIVLQVEIQFVRSVTSRGKLGYLLKLDSVTSREEADELKGTMILVKTSDRKDLVGDSEFYVQDLIGLEVRLKSTEGEDYTVVGTVADVYDGTGAHDTLDVELSDSFVAETLRKSSGGGDEDGKEAEEEGEKKKKKGRGKKECVLVPFVREIVPVVNAQQGFCEITPPEGLLESCMYRKKK